MSNSDKNDASCFEMLDGVEIGIIVYLSYSSYIHIMHMIIVTYHKQISEFFNWSGYVSRTIDGTTYNIFQYNLLVEDGVISFPYFLALFPSSTFSIMGLFFFVFL